jgi:hypothetical protein
MKVEPSGSFAPLQSLGLRKPKIRLGVCFDSPELFEPGDGMGFVWSRLLDR